MAVRQPENLYLNLDYNPTEGTGQQVSQAIINQTMTAPLLDKPSDYYASIVRFSIPTEAIPIFRWPVDTSQNVSSNISTLKIGVTDGITKYTEPLYFVPSTLGPNPAPTVLPGVVSPPYYNKQQLDSNYFAVYNIDVLIRAFNIAIEAAMIAGGFAQPRPYFIYDPVTELISVIVNTTFSTALLLYINFDSLNYLESFPFNYNLAPTASDDFYFKFDVLPYLGTNPYKFVQEYSAMNLWYDATKIIITSNSLPIRSEAVPLNNTGVANSFPIFTDFQIAFDSVRAANTTAIYNPISQYRLVDLVNDSPLSKIDLGFLYQTKNGGIYPIFVTKSQVISVKIGFFIKSLYNNSDTQHIKKNDEANRVLGIGGNLSRLMHY